MLFFKWRVTPFLKGRQYSEGTLSMFKIFDLENHLAIFNQISTKYQEVIKSVFKFVKTLPFGVCAEDGDDGLLGGGRLEPFFKRKYFINENHRMKNYL